jgi:hypothetical protein
MGADLNRRPEYMYSSGEATLTLPIAGKLATYPAGGYVLSMDLLSGDADET